MIIFRNETMLRNTDIHRALSYTEQMAVIQALISAKSK